MSNVPPINQLLLQNVGSQLAHLTNQIKKLEMKMDRIIFLLNTNHNQYQQGLVYQTVPQQHYQPVLSVQPNGKYILVDTNIKYKNTNNNTHTTNKNSNKNQEFNAFA